MQAAKPTVMIHQLFHAQIAEVTTARPWHARRHQRAGALL
jgi:hypothetical protein